MPNPTPLFNILTSKQTASQKSASISQAYSGPGPSSSGSGKSSGGGGGGGKSSGGGQPSTSPLIETLMSGQPADVKSSAIVAQNQPLQQQEQPIPPTSPKTPQDVLAEAGITPETISKYQSITIPTMSGSGYAYQDTTVEGSDPQAYQKLITHYEQAAEWIGGVKQRFAEEEYLTKDVPEQHPELQFLITHGSPGSVQRLKKSMFTDTTPPEGFVGPVYDPFAAATQEAYQSLTPEEKEEYSALFTDWGLISVKERKYYPGGTKHLESHKEKSIDEFLKSGGYKEDVGQFARHYLYEGKMFTEKAHGVNEEKYMREMAWEQITLTPEQIKTKTYETMPPGLRAATSFTGELVKAAAFPITLPQSVVKMATGGKTIFLPDVSKKLDETFTYGSPGVISPAIGERWLGQDVSHIKEQQMKYPIETAFATGGEIVGLFLGGKAMGVGTKPLRTGLSKYYTIASSNLPRLPLFKSVFKPIKSFQFQHADIFLARQMYKQPLMKTAISGYSKPSYFTRAIGTSRKMLYQLREPTAYEIMQQAGYKSYSKPFLGSQPYGTSWNITTLEQIHGKSPDPFTAYRGSYPLQSPGWEAYRTMNVEPSLVKRTLSYSFSEKGIIKPTPTAYTYKIVDLRTLSFAKTKVGKNLSTQLYKTYDEFAIPPKYAVENPVSIKDFPKGYFKTTWSTRPTIAGKEIFVPPKTPLKFPQVGEGSWFAKSTSAKPIDTYFPRKYQPFGSGDFGYRYLGEQQVFISTSKYQPYGQVGLGYRYAGIQDSFVSKYTYKSFGTSDLGYRYTGIQDIFMPIRTKPKFPQVGEGSWFAKSTGSQPIGDVYKIKPHDFKYITTPKTGGTVSIQSLKPLKAYKPSTSSNIVSRGFTPTMSWQKTPTFLELLEMEEGITGISSYWSGFAPVQQSGQKSSYLNRLDVFSTLSFESLSKSRSRQKEGIGLINLSLPSVASILKPASITNVSQIQLSLQSSMQKQLQKQLQIQKPKLELKIELELDTPSYEPGFYDYPEPYTPGGSTPIPLFLLFDESQTKYDTPRVRSKRKKGARKKIHPVELLYKEIIG